MIGRRDVHLDPVGRVVAVGRGPAAEAVAVGHHQPQAVQALARQIDFRGLRRSWSSHSFFQLLPLSVSGQMSTLPMPLGPNLVRCDSPPRRAWC